MAETVSGLESLWRGIGHAIAPGVALWLRRRVAQGKEDAARLGERAGIASIPRPAGLLIWSHAASVGEAMALIPLLQRLQIARPDITLLITTGTRTSAATVAARAPGLLHQYLPSDLPQAVDRFFAHWRPNLVLWSESELWPGLLTGAARRGIPMLLLNARMSERSCRRWQRVPGIARWLLAGFETIYAQSQADAERYRALGAVDVQSLGNLKLAAPPLPADEAALAALQAQTAGRRLWLMASTHPGEDEPTAAVQQVVAARHPGLLGIVVPRHPERGPSVADALRQAGLKVSRRAAGEAITAETDIHVADTLGELGLWYRLCPVAVMGGSLIDHGGQNPMEPTRLGRAVLFGPHMFNFSEIAAALLARGAALQVPDAAALGNELARLLGDRAALAAMGQAGAAFAAEQNTVLDKTEQAVLQRLQKL